MNSKNLLITTSILLALALSACDMKKQLTEMHDSTGEMNETTKKMNATTEGMHTTMQGMEKTTVGMDGKMKGMNATMEIMNEKMEGMKSITQDMLEQTNELYDAAKLGDSSMQRRAALEALGKATATGRKVTEAVKYFISFEYQLFSGFGQDQSDDKRKHLLYEATLEFFKDITEFTTKETVPQPLAQAAKGGDDNKEASFNALAVSLHKMNRKQEEYIKKNNLKEEDSLSMYKVILSALAKKKAIDEGQLKLSELADYEREVLNNEEVAIKLIQARSNITAAIVLNGVSDIQKDIPGNGPIASLLKELSDVAKGVLKGAEMRFKKWDVPVAKINAVQSETAIKYIASILATHKYLKEIGVQPIYNQTLVEILKRAQWVEVKDENANLAKAHKDLQDAYQKLLMIIE